MFLWREQGDYELRKKKKSVDINSVCCVTVCAGFCWESLNEGDCLEDLNDSGWIILELVWKK